MLSVTYGEKRNEERWFIDKEERSFDVNNSKAVSGKHFSFRGCPENK